MLLGPSMYDFLNYNWSVRLIKGIKKNTLAMLSNYSQSDNLPVGCFTSVFSFIYC